MSFSIASLTTYPIKGLAGQTHDEVMMTAGQILPGDRAFALSSGTSQSREADKNSWLKKAHFLQQMTIAELAHLAVSFHPSDNQLTLTAPDNRHYQGQIDQSADSARLIDFITDFLNWPDDKAKPELFHLAEGGMTDTKTPFVSFGNRASITDFAKKANLTDDESRFRLNIMMTGEPAFAENDLIGCHARLGDAEFYFCEPVGRCAAIEVDPQTALRRKGLVSELADCYGTADMGIFAEVTKSGKIAIGDELILL